MQNNNKKRDLKEDKKDHGFQELLMNIRQIDRAKQKLNEQYALMGEQLEDVQEILCNQQMSKKQVGQRIQDYFLTAPSGNRKSKHYLIENQQVQINRSIDKIKIPMSHLKNKPIEIDYEKAKKFDLSVKGFRNSIDEKIVQNPSLLQFVPLQESLINKKFQAHDHRKTWIQANYLNTDPKFQEKWQKQQSSEQLMCVQCRQNDIIKANCQNCSAVWCSFTNKMLKEYSSEIFDKFNIRNDVTISTYVMRKVNKIEQKVPIELILTIKPHFHVMDDSFTIADADSKKGKRIIYYNKIEKVERKDNEKDIKLELFKENAKLNFQAQFRMTSPYKVDDFGIGFTQPNPNIKTKLDQIMLILNDRRLTPESIPSDRVHQTIQMGLHSRYQRYELMSCVPICILVRTIRDRYFQQEISNIKHFYANNPYNAVMGYQDRIKIKNGDQYSS